MVVRPLPPSDFYFTYPAFQFRALLESFDLVERHFGELIKKRSRPGIVATSVNAQLHQDMVDAMMPQAYRGAFLIALWATYETTVKIVSDTLRRFQPSIARFVPPRENWLPGVETYFAQQLRFSLFPKIRGIKNEMDALQRIRHVLAHANGLKQATNRKHWRILVPYARRHPGIDLNRGFLHVTPEFVRGRFEMMAPAISHIVTKGQQQLAANPRFVEFERNH